jgi:hypothetical protein
MPGYINASLHKCHHPDPACAEHAPHTCNPPVYGSKSRYIEETGDIPSFSPKDVNHLQQLGVTPLYYSISMGLTLIMPVNVLASEQTQAAAETADKIIKLHNYCTPHPEATLRYHVSDMILNIHIDASYLSEREA